MALDRWAKTYQRTFRAAAGLLLLATLPVSAFAQSVFGSYEHDTDDVDIVYLGGQLPLSGNVAGLTPFIGFGSYWLAYNPAPNQDATVTAITPMVGLTYSTPSGASVSGSLGYQFQHTDEDSPLPLVGGRGDGVTTGLSAGYWGAGLIHPEADVSYNWGSEYIWSRGRATVGVTPAVRLGAEVVAQGETGAEDGYSSFSFGPYVSFGVARGLSVGAGAGWKNDSNPGSAHYFLVDFAWTRSQ